MLSNFKASCCGKKVPVALVLLILSLNGAFLYYWQMNQTRGPGTQESKIHEPAAQEPAVQEQNGKRGESATEQTLGANKPFPNWYQTFPISRYPNLTCYIITSDKRLDVFTSNCNFAYVLEDKIVIDDYVIPRESTKYCKRCYLSDYLNMVSLMLFGRPAAGIPPLAPGGLLLIEDDSVICKDALDLLDECHRNQYNCILGFGTGMNYFAGPKTPQPQRSNLRFETLSQLNVRSSVYTNNHADWYIRVLRRHKHDVKYTNHVGKNSVLGHGYDPKNIHCAFNDSIAQLRPLPRTIDVNTELVCPRCG